jgi:Protein of unknown function (DUF2490)
MKRRLLIGVFCCAALALWGQKTYVHEEQTWFGVFNQIRLNQRWGFWHDTHFRLKDHYVSVPSQFLFRFGPTWYITDDVRLTVAYNFINHFPEEAHENISRPEHRPFQQIQWYTRYGKTRLMQWVRLDERFRRNILNDNELAAGYTFNWRARYNFALFIPLSKKGLAPRTFQILLNNELMVNFGKNIVYNYFDQNRSFVGMVYQFSKESHLQLGYMYLFQQQAAGNRYRKQNTIRLFYSHNFDLRKK